VPPSFERNHFRGRRPLEADVGIPSLLASQRAAAWLQTGEVLTPPSSQTTQDRSRQRAMVEVGSKPMPAGCILACR
jgi:hypothetical protein